MPDTRIKQRVLMAAIAFLMIGVASGGYVIAYRHSTKYAVDLCRHNQELILGAGLALETDT